MGRSVSVPSDAVATAYIQWEPEDPHDSQWEWDYFIDDLLCVLQRSFRSFAAIDVWVSNEEKAILENSQARVVVAEYCGLVSVSLVPCDLDYYDESLRGLRDHWCKQVTPKLLKTINETFGGLKKIGTFSNGCSVYEKV